MNIWKSAVEKLNSIFGLDLNAETGTELDEQLDALMKEKEGKGATDKPEKVAETVAEAAQEAVPEKSTELDDLTAERDLLQEEVDKLTGDIAQRDANITELSDQLAEANKSLTEAQAEVQTLTDQVKESEDANAKLKEANDELIRKSEKRTKVVRVEQPGVSSMATAEKESEVGEVKKIRIKSNEQTKDLKTGFRIAR